MVVVAAAEFGDHLQHVAQPQAAGEAAQIAGLDGGAIGHRIGERHADLDDVGAGAASAVEDRRRGRDVGIARRHEGDQRGAAFGGAGGEAGGEAILRGLALTASPRALRRR